MPPIPIYSSSPINAAKAAGVTPKTAGPGAAANTQPIQQPGRPTPTPTTKDGLSNTSYPPPKPGAAPAAPTPATDQSIRAPMSYAPSGLAGITNPPPPQPGAAPMVPGRSSSIPPPPRTGESVPANAPSFAPTTTMPPQMGIPPPTTTQAQRSSTTTAFPGPPLAGQRPTGLPTGPTQGIAGPPVYQQAAHPMPSAREWSDGSGYGDNDEGVWGAAKKWAQNAGDSLAAAESEVWRRINKE